MQSDPLKLRFRETLADLFAFQCVLVALRGIPSDDSEEMLWQTFLSALVDQFGFRTVWYGRTAGGELRPIASAGVEDSLLREARIPADHAVYRAIAEGAPQTGGDALALPLVVEGQAEGGLMIRSAGEAGFAADRIERLEILLAEAGSLIAERRSHLRMEQALRESEQKYRALIQNTVDWVWQLDPAGRFVYSSARVRDLLGYEPDEVLDKAPEDILPGAKSAPAFGAMLGQGAPFQLAGRHREGREVIFEVQGTPWAGGWVGTCRDITERIRASAALEAAKEQAEAANRSKTQFLAAMSHEIRTPMNGVIGMAALLADTSLTAEQMDCLDTIRASGRALLALIDDILDLSKIEAGRLELEHQPFQLRDCVAQAFDLMAAQAAEKSLELAYRFGPGVPETVTGDAARLRQVLLNLAGNAVKFTDKGEVILSVNAGPHELTFALRDTGTGIPAEHIGRLFKPFSQADSATSRRFGGTGLGLAISKRLVERMGGRIWVESEPGQGSTFQFTVEMDAPVYPAALPAFPGRRLLVAEPNATVREIFVELAAGWGLEAYGAASEAEALERIARLGPFDVAVSVYPDLPVKLVRMTSVANRTAGALVKPVRPAHLHAALARALSQSAGGEIDRVETRFDPQTAARHPLRILVAEDNRVNQKVIDYTLKRLGYSPILVANGAEAVAAVRDRQFDVILMDVRMPGIDGLEATRRIRAASPTGKRPRIIAMTAAAFAEDRDLCIAAGMDDYVAKPVEVENLAAALRRAGPTAAS